MNAYHDPDPSGETRDDPTLETSETGLPAESDTQLVEQTHTQHIETEAVTVNTQHPTGQGPAPFRVEPATPVPDDAVSPDDGDTRALPSLQVPPAASSTQPGAPILQPSPPASARGQGLVTVRRGPLPMTIMLGLLSLIVAGYVLVTNLMGADFDMRVAGPAMFGTFGGLLLVVGLVGVIAGGRGRNRD